MSLTYIGDSLFETLTKNLETKYVNLINKN